METPTPPTLARRQKRAERLHAAQRKVLAARFQQLRGWAGWDQETVAQRAGLSAVTVGSIENNLRVSYTTNYVRLAEAYNMSLEVVLDTTEADELKRLFDQAMEADDATLLVRRYRQASHATQEHIQAVLANPELIVSAPPPLSSDAFLSEFLRMPAHQQKFLREIVQLLTGYCFPKRRRKRRSL